VLPPPQAVVNTLETKKPYNKDIQFFHDVRSILLEEEEEKYFLG
jgi:hypothetical protein